MAHMKKLKIVIGEEYNQTLSDMYFDIDLIGGFYPTSEIVDGEETDAIFCFAQGGFILVVPDQYLIDYLDEKFVKPSKRNRYAR